MSTTRFLDSFLLVVLGLALAVGVQALPDAKGDAVADPAADASREKLSADERARLIEQEVTQGALRVVKDDGSVVECPLRHTDVQADVSGFIARVKVTQTFYNPTDERIEAVYVFPLPHQAVVDDMTMVIGERKIVGIIKRRAEARSIYEQALASGQTAALLEQERPNIFTQSVGNIDPLQEVHIEIHYVDVLEYDMGTYEYHFPMVVGPRFMPGAPRDLPQATPLELRGKVSPPVPDTTRVPDASRISPPVLKPGYRNGHNISLVLRLDAGVPVQGIKVANHEADVVRDDDRRAKVTLSPADAIPNKDFVLRYHVAGKRPEMAMLAHTGDRKDTRRLGRGYFMLMVQPKEDQRLRKSPPREIVFLLDTSGSMSGQPTEKVKETMRDMLGLCRDVDTLQVIAFASQTRQLFDKPVPVTRSNVAKALDFTRGLQGGGGTYMLQGVKRAIDQPIDRERVRIVIMLTDGYIGNEAEIIEHVGRNCGDQVRFWAIGIGSSPNMFLVDGVARQGGGMGKRLGLEDKAAGLAEEVITRIQRAQLANIRIDWGGLDIAETYPAELPELWAGRPVVVFGRYRGGGQAKIQLTGRVEGEPVRWPLHVSLPTEQPKHEVLAKVWSRKKIEDLMQQTFYAGSPAVEEEVTAIALDYGLMSQYTSFVAVDAEQAKELEGQHTAQPPRRMLVPVPLPAGTQWEGFFGSRGESSGIEEKLALGSLAGKALEDSLARDGRSNRKAYFGRVSSRRRAIPLAASSPSRLMAGRALSRNWAMQQSGQALALYGFSTARPSPAPQTRAYGRAARRRSSSVRLGQAVNGPVPSLQRGLNALAEYDEAADGASIYQILPAVLSVDAERTNATATELLTAGRQLAEQEKLELARAKLAHAYFLAAASANMGDGTGTQLASQILETLESLHQQQVKHWQDQLPGLKTKLQVVLRDVSISEALEQVLGTSDLKSHVLPGSLDDVRELVDDGSTRITYLDLRGVTIAQALDWVLQPARLTWRPNQERDNTIVIGSDRRLAGQASWVYDVSLIGLPTREELGTDDDWNQTVAKAKQETDQFIEAIRGTLDASQTEVVWYAPGQLLIVGDGRRHEQAARLLEQLADPQAQPAGISESLHAKTTARVAKRQPQLEKRLRAEKLLNSAAVHNHYGWSLLAAAFGGQLDLEALTELQIAWAADETDELLAGSGSGLLLRSAWSITTAERMLPDQEELGSLAEFVTAKIRPAARKAVGAYQAKPQDIAGLLPAVYACLAMDDTFLTAKLLVALPDGAEMSEDMAPVATAARVLLDPSAQDSSAELRELISEGNIQGEDVTVLVALACRRSDGDTWAAFRASMNDLLGRQPLSGSVIVLVNRLSGNGF